MFQLVRIGLYSLGLILLVVACLPFIELLTTRKELKESALGGAAVAVVFSGICFLFGYLLSRKRKHDDDEIITLADLKEGNKERDDRR